MQKIAFLLFFFLLVGFQLTTKAQINLVENPSFEDLKSHDSISFPFFNIMKTWHGTDSGNITYNPAALFTYPNRYGHLPTPDASWGNGGVYQYPRSGNVVIVLTIYTDSGFNAQDYAVGKLNKPLEAGEHYCVTFYTNLSKPLDECIATNHVCAYVGDSTIDTIQNSRGLIIHNISPQIQCANVISDTMNWTQLQANFIATGSESRIILGNFYQNYQDSVLVISPLSAGRAAEYFIDDVSVVASASTISAGGDKTINQGDTITLGKGITEGLPCDWFTASGTPVYRGSTPTITPTKTTTYVVKMDLCGSISTDTMTVFVIPTGMEQLTNNTHLLIYPNPCKDRLSVVGIQFSGNTKIEVIDLLGRIVLTQSPLLKAQSYSIDVSHLTAQVYILKATDEKGNVKVAKFVKE